MKAAAKGIARMNPLMAKKIATPTPPCEASTPIGPGRRRRVHDGLRPLEVHAEMQENDGRDREKAKAVDLG